MHACRQKRSKAKHKQKALAEQALALAVAACLFCCGCGCCLWCCCDCCGPSYTGPTVSALTALPTCTPDPAKCLAAPTTMGAPLKKVKQPTLFQAFKTPPPKAAPTVEIEPFGQGLAVVLQTARQRRQRPGSRFFAAKKKFFEIPVNDRARMTSSADFIQFWQSIVVDTAMATPLRHCAGAVLLACPSSCDAERAISTLNHIVTALHNRLSWPMIRMHLIGAEDIVEEGYPYDMVAELWGATPRRRRRTS